MIIRGWVNSGSDSRRSVNNPYFALLRTAWRYAGDLRPRMALIYALFTITNLIAVAKPAVYGWFIGRIQTDGGRVLETTWWYGAAYLAMSFGSWFIHGPSRVAEQKLAFEVGLRFLRERYHQVLHLPLGWHQDHHSGATINRLRKAFEALRTFISDGFSYVFVPVRMLFSLLAMLYFSPLFGLFALAMTAVTTAIILRFDKPLIPILHEVNEREHAVSANLFDSLSNIVTVITLRLERSMENGLLRQALAILNPFRRFTILNEWKWFTAENVVALTYVAIVVGFVWQHRHDGAAFPLGGLVALIGYIGQYASDFQGLTWQYSTMVRFQTDIDSARDIEAQYHQQHRPDAPADLPAGWRTARISGLGFAHREGGAAGVEDIELNLTRGRRIALVGESGSGKSTLLALLRGLYQPRPGCRVSVDGQAGTLGSLNETTTLFPQEPEIFENTIEFNVTLGLPVSEADVRRVCEVAQFAPVIDELPRGLASSIQEKGVNLSGGQKQRLALARGILAAEDCEIVLLDEPTSSVDPKTELAIYERMFADFQGKAVVSALHRLHLLRLFDEVCVMERGRIVARGTLEELLAGRSVFRELWRHQEEKASAER